MNLIWSWSDATPLVQSAAAGDVFLPEHLPGDWGTVTLELLPQVSVCVTIVCGCVGVWVCLREHYPDASTAAPIWGGEGGRGAHRHCCQYHHHSPLSQPSSSPSPLPSASPQPSPSPHASDSASPDATPSPDASSSSSPVPVPSPFSLPSGFPCCNDCRNVLSRPVLWFHFLFFHFPKFSPHFLRLHWCISFIFWFRVLLSERCFQLRSPLSVFVFPFLDLT